MTSQQEGSLVQQATNGNSEEEEEEAEDEEEVLTRFVFGVNLVSHIQRN